MTYVKKTKTDKNTRICGHCINEFDLKDIFVALVPPNNDYYTVYCDKCLKELGITEFKPYNKPRIKKAKKESDNVKKTEKKTVAKKTEKKTVAKKTETKSDKISSTKAVEKIKKITKK